MPTDNPGGAAPQYRHEWKHELSCSDLLSIRARLRAVMEPDPHAVDGRYFIRSLYFDNPDDRALREKLDGVNRREKFRIRYYNGDTSLIHLEKKSKVNGLGTKSSAPLTAEEAQRIVEGDRRLDGGLSAIAHTGALPQDALSGAAAEDHRGLHAGAVYLPPRQRARDL
jgi:hypothetical protein